jgi:acetyl-CoA carboxylase biotin carboxyl carrier protein
MFLVLAVLTRVAGAEPDEPQDEPVPTYIVSPSTGTFVAGAYRGAEPYVSIGSRLEPGNVVGNVEVWGKLQPVYATVGGTVIEILVVDEAMVTTRQPLFKVQIEAEPTPA